MKFLILSLFLLLTSCQHNKLTSSWHGDHVQLKELISLSSVQGQQYLHSVDSKKLKGLKAFWEPQRPSFCGVCSVVIVGNELNNNNNLDQDNFFSPQVNEMITAKAVSRMGLTLREMSQAAAYLMPKVKIKKFYAHTAGLDLFREQLRTELKQEKTHMIVNFSRQSLAGKGMNWGHFSIVAAYDVKERKVLVLEVEGSRDSFWVSDKDLYSAMLAIDPVSRIPRGWAVIKK